jgi:hypothetical protein
MFFLTTKLYMLLPTLETVAITAIAYKLKPPRNVGTHTWERGESISVHGRKVTGLPAQSFSQVLNGRVFDGREILY